MEAASPPARPPRDRLPGHRGPHQMSPAGATAAGDQVDRQPWRSRGLGSAQLSVGATGARTLTLRVTDGGDGRNFDHADWAEARLPC
ncbi:NPCBM/NEW2 domain-containing protein [Crossiella sp. SN42]|uniref:NPCBM/NEW2 domain-containing protein n=1 Tax=Crossiella sp. SN42 TaxID=2944808 RepID=UPI0027DEE858|nr:NPCBM/NEW2 domain-containing protein [Crossiella sp. SN42]